jgi:succinoglycan biosynthesis protein ExoA
VGDIAAQDFSGELEVIVADGRSTDRSVETLRSAAENAGIACTVVDNPERWVSHGLNECIRRSRGDLIVRLDCHTRYPSDYISALVAAAEDTGAWCIGGVTNPVGRTVTERAVACAMSSPFGGIAWSRESELVGRFEVDTVFCGAFRPEAFRAVGVYDTSLKRNQDDELTLRLRLAGGRVVLDPSIRAWYTPRGSYRAVFRQYYEYGLWKIPVMLKHRQTLSARSLVPAAFLTTVAILAVAATVSPRSRWLLGAEVGAYATAAAAFACRAVAKRSEHVSLVPRVILVFPAFHLAYGAGFVRGVLGAAAPELGSAGRSRRGDEPGHARRFAFKRRVRDDAEAA